MEEFSGKGTLKIVKRGQQSYGNTYIAYYQVTLGHSLCTGLLCEGSCAAGEVILFQIQRNGAGVAWSGPLTIYADFGLGFRLDFDFDFDFDFGFCRDFDFGFRYHCGLFW